MSENDECRQHAVDHGEDEGAEHYPSIDCLALIEEYEDAPDECTILPRVDSQPVSKATWVTAREGSYLALEDAR